jgi:H+/Cl- antiporter ClcA
MLAAERVLSWSKRGRTDRRYEMDGTIGTLLFVAAAIALVVVLASMIFNKRVRSEAQTREGLLRTEPRWVRIVGLLILLGGAFLVLRR